MTRLSVAIISRNREKQLAECLKSVKGADEIVVLDTGSIDSAPQVAIEHGARLYYYRWEDDFAAARNRCLDYVRNSWTLMIDTDEVLATGIDSVYKTIDKNFAAKVIGVKLNQPDGSSFYRPSLFRKESAHYERAIHEQLNRTPDLVTDAVTIQHRPNGDHRNDPQRNIRILRAELERNPLSFLDAYYLGEELYGLGQYDAAVYWLSLFLETTKRVPNITAEAYYLLADCYCKLHRVGVAIEYLVEAIKCNPQFKAAYERLYVLTKNESWRAKAAAATNDNVLKIR